MDSRYALNPSHTDWLETTCSNNISDEKYYSIKEKFDVPKKGDILVSSVGTIGISWVVSDSRKFYFKDGNLLWIKEFDLVLPVYLKHVLDFIFANHIFKYIFGAAYKALTIVKLKQFEIPLPPLETQKEIVAQIEKEQSLVNVKELIPCLSKKSKTKSPMFGGNKCNGRSMANTGLFTTLI